MTVKASVRHDTTQKKMITFPKIMIKEDKMLVVLFCTEDHGTVLDPGDSGHTLGHYRDDWDMPQFIDFHPNSCITLRNSYVD